MRIFAEGRLSDYLNSRLQASGAEVLGEDKNKLLNVAESDYLRYLLSKYEIPSLEIGFAEVTITERDEMIRAERFPGDFNVYAGKSYPKQVITYHIPFAGNEDLLHLKPSTGIAWTTEVAIRPGDISFDVINWREDPDPIKRDADSIIGNIRVQFTNVQKETSAWNEALPAIVKQAIAARKQKLMKELGLLAQLGVPMRKSGDIPATFSVPFEKRMPIVKKPMSSTAPYAPEPAIDDSTYHSILQVCSDMGREMERHPSLYFDKDEEAVRDLFIMLLSPNFQSVTGETFNKAGKTDILVRHDAGNVFVAECKFRSGPACLPDAIDQLLSYLTWRDSKSALLLFVKNKDFSHVLSQVNPLAVAHPCFVQAAPPSTETWFNSVFRLPQDGSRHIRLAILCFHLPPSQESTESA